MGALGSALSTAVAQPAPLTLAALPHALLLEVLSRLPADSRLRCAAVCRAWRAALNDRRLWLRLDLSPASGVARAAATEGLLRAAAARAAGQLETLDVSGCVALSRAALLEVVRANSASLRELHLRGGCEKREFWLAAQVKALLRAAPHLRACNAAVGTGDLAVARAMMRAEPPFRALRLHRLCVFSRAGTEAAVLELAADLLHCVFLRELDFYSAALDGPAAFDALVDAALACGLHTLRLYGCYLSTASAPALARLLVGGALAELEIRGLGGDRLLDVPAAAVLGSALRACSTLTALTLRTVRLWRDFGAATTLLGALTGHASLQTLDLSHNQMKDDAAVPAAASAALGALAGANAPALTELDVSWCYLGDAGLGPLLDALAHNTHLTKLDFSYNDLMDAFVCDALLPAVRANSSLRQLICASVLELPSTAAYHASIEAETLVAQRAAG
jgi:hypothetical protein